MQYETIRTETRGKSFILTLDRPEARNALSTRMWAEITDALLAFESNDDLWVLILANTGSCFCAGSDIKEIDAGTYHAPQGFAQYGFATLTGRYCPKPIIAAINGLAVGGGAELLLASDLAILSNDGQIGFPEVSRGMLASGGGGLLKIGRSIPLKFAAEIILTGDRVDAQTALSWGLVNRVVEPDEVLDAALKMADAIIKNSPVAVKRSKFLLYDCMDKSFLHENDGWRMMTDSDDDIKKTEDAKEGTRAFAEHRPPEWHNC